jgi:hypothetical protein
MWIIEEIPRFEQLTPADQLGLIAPAVEDNCGPAEYVCALRFIAAQLEELGWWMSGERTLASTTRDP